MRGTNIAPHFLPAQFWDTRIQQELFSSFFPSRSQWNCTFTRPYWSTKISSPAGPTNTAGCEPCTTGWGVARAGRNGVECGMHSKCCLLYTSDAADEEDSVDIGGR